MSRAKRICSDVSCGKVAVSFGCCQEHSVDLDRSRGTRQERGYGAEHDAARRRLMAEFGRAYRGRQAPSCWRCGLRLHPWQALHADHSGVSARDGGVADRIVHAWCNTGKALPSGRWTPSQRS